MDKPYLHRKIDTFLSDWKSEPKHKPLIVKGPRQVGKSESIRCFGEKNYKSLIEINFLEEPKYQGITRDGYSVNQIIKNITLLDPSKNFIEGDTLIFFDELQDSPDIATSLKFFMQDARYDVICSGSMLGINYKKIESNSVGYKTDFDMFSMDFEEYLWALGFDSTMIDSLFNHLLEVNPYSKLEMKVYMDAFLDFCTLGGMPEIVSAFVESESFAGTLKMQQQLLLDYKEDIQKYADGVDKTRVLNVFNHIPVQLAKENKKFQISKVASGARSNTYRGCVDWLETAGMANVCYCLNYPELPLKGNYREDKFKLYFCDSGMLVAMLDEESAEDLRANRNLGVYKGALYESIVAEALKKQGYGLYYFKKDDSTLEEDFFVRSQNYLIPVEVKAKGGTSKSLKTLINSDSYEDISFGIKYSSGNIGFSNKVLTMPYFTAFLLKRLIQKYDDGEVPLFF